MRTIGVFDSGVGGISVLKEILKEFPYDNIIYLEIVYTLLMEIERLKRFEHSV